MLNHVEDGRRLYEALPDAGITIVEDAGHKVHHTHPDVVMDALKQLKGRL